LKLSVSTNWGRNESGPWLKTRTSDGSKANATFPQTATAAPAKQTYRLYLWVFFMNRDV
jgi:hypothetical protein